MADRFASFASSGVGSATRHVAITPSDSTDIANRPRAIYCQAAGTVVIRDEAGTDLSYAMTAGQVLPFRGVRVLATGTTGTYYAWD